MGQIQNVLIIIIVTVMLAIVTLGLAYLFDLYLNPFIIIVMTYLHLLNLEIFHVILLSISQLFLLIMIA
jgi:hypothetical protein